VTLCVNAGHEMALTDNQITSLTCSLAKNVRDGEKQM
jgi:hypothetical protein